MTLGTSNSSMYKSSTNTKNRIIHSEDFNVLWDFGDVLDFKDIEQNLYLNHISLSKNHNYSLVLKFFLFHYHFDVSLLCVPSLYKMVQKRKGQGKHTIQSSIELNTLATSRF